MSDIQGGPEKHVRSPAAGVVGGCQSPYGAGLSVRAEVSGLPSHSIAPLTAFSWLRISPATSYVPGKRCTTELHSKIWALDVLRQTHQIAQSYDSLSWKKVKRGAQHRKEAGEEGIRALEKAVS